MGRGGPSSSFEIRFDGPQISPEAIPLRVLTPHPSAVQRLLADDEEQAEGMEDEAERPVGIELHLLDVKRGSATYPVFADHQDEALTRLRLAGQILASPERVNKAPVVLSPVEELSGIAKSLRCAD